ncbi:hypothetical protein evm_011206 [Chilo suppressalis]|nr:hypothetical protein evm_011206 [Chilo suppressalis]
MSATLNSGSVMPRDAKNNGVPSGNGVNKILSDKKSENGISVRARNVIKVKSVIPRKRQDLLKWYGWGYKDSMFKLQGDTAYFTGNRYCTPNTNN